MGPLVICTATALLILFTGSWQVTGVSGVTITSIIFESALPGHGSFVLIVCIFFFSITTIFSYSYYGSKCLGLLIGAERKHYYKYLIILMTVFASMLSLAAMVGLIAGAFALMAIPTMTSTIILAPKVMLAERIYFAKI